MIQPVSSGRVQPAVAVVGTYPPRRCGIATFTCDLVDAIARIDDAGPRIYSIALHDPREALDYAGRVRLAIDHDAPHEYERAADYLNRHSDVVCLQHEFGIFGGEWGSHILRLIRRLVKPLVVTCHTIPTSPPPDQRIVMREIVSYADRLVVMNRSAIDVIERQYGADRNKIVYIPHGIHDMPFTNPGRTKPGIGVKGRVLLTFGLLHRNKGMEFMVDAMPVILSRHPDTFYVIAGNTHPAIAQQEGESYRESLVRRAESLGVGENVILIDRFSELSELLKLLSESDVFVAPYLNLDQMTSGALSYAVGAGKAVVATPFLHAKELLAEGRGRFVPAGKSLPLAREIISLFDDPDTTEAMRRKAYAHSRSMVWDKSARVYHRLFSRVFREHHAMPAAALSGTRQSRGAAIATSGLRSAARARV